MKRLIVLIAIILLVVAISQRSPVFNSLNLKDFFNLSKKTQNKPVDIQKNNVVYEESTITDVVGKSLPSVVTIGIVANNQDPFNNPFSPFSPFRQQQQQQQPQESNIGSGFIISEDGLIITNKHVVSDTSASYKVLTNDDKKYDVVKIYRDPLNDLSILKINATGLKPLPLGDSSKLKLGQLAIAIGTPLGEFRNTVTSGIVSGLGRGINAGSPYEGYVEKLDNVIQTDAAISPGNSGGPLLNSGGQVIGVNTAIASEGQNIGFAIPSNVVRDLINKFNQNGGSFERPYIGVRYKMIDRQTAILNELVEGAYVVEVIPGSPGAQAGLQEEDVIIEFDGQRIKGADDQSLTKLILEKKVGDTVKMKIWRNGQTKDLTIKLEASPNS